MKYASVLLLLINCNLWAQATPASTPETEEMKLTRVFATYLNQVHKIVLNVIEDKPNNKDEIVRGSSNSCPQDVEGFNEYYLSDKQYIKKLALSKDCNFEGEIKKITNEKVLVNLKVENLYDYKNLKYSYIDERPKAQNIYTSATKISQGEFTGLDGHNIKFNLNITQEVDREKLKKTNFSYGIDIKPIEVIVTEIDGYKVNIPLVLK